MSVIYIEICLGVGLDRRRRDSRLLRVRCKGLFGLELERIEE